MKVAITGATGNMGRQALLHILNLKNIEGVKLLVLPEDKRIKKLLKLHKNHKDKITVIYGSIADKDSVKELVQGVDYVVNMAAVIPPLSDKRPEKAVECNETGVNVLVTEIENAAKQPKLIHISTVALYGNRNKAHMWGRVGDPLLVSPFDLYSATKLRGEFRVLESSVENWVVLRQTAMLHKNMLSDNMSDGLMFHTCFDAPLEWATADDSGRLIANILEKDSGSGAKNFWKRCFNIGGGQVNRITGYETLDDGFKIIGGSAKDYFKPNYNSMRNFHGMWFYDGDALDEMFKYQTQSVASYWKGIKATHRYYGLAKIVPKSLISKFAIRRLFKDSNSPAYWKKHNDTAKLVAYFGGKAEYDGQPKNWNDFTPLCESEDYGRLKDITKAELLPLGYDYGKKDEEITLSDMQSVAAAHGGRLVSASYDGDLYKKLQWETQDGEEFSAAPYTVLRAGHWYNAVYKKNVWDFDRLSGKDKIFAALWRDSHAESEENLYYFDEDYTAKIK